MPQREFWTKQIPCSITFTFHSDPVKDAEHPWAYMAVKDQEQAVMATTGAMLPPGFAAYAFADACKAATEAFESSDALSAQRAFARTVAEWRKAAQSQ